MKATHILLLIAACCISIPSLAAERLSVLELLDKYTANRSKLTSYIAKAEQTYSVQWLHIDKPNLGRLVSEFRTDGRKMYALHYNWDNLPTINAETSIEDSRCWADLWNGKCSILYNKRMSAEDSSVVISTEERLVKHNMIVWYDGMPLLGIRHSDYEPIDSVLRRADSISIRPELEQVGSVACYVVDANATSGTYTVWFDPQHGYQITRADIRVGPGDVFRARSLENNESDTLSIRSVGFENVEGTWVPMEADICGTSIRQRQNSSCTSTAHHKITKITCNPDHEALGSFVPVVENGTEVYDRDSGTRYTWQAGKKFVVDEWDGRIRYVPEDWSIRVGVGRELPAFEGIELDLSAEDIRDKAILLCLLDMNQRPSRNCLLQLSTRAKELMVKDVVVIAVQASKIDDSVLNEWVEKNNIPFPVGMVKGDEEKTRFTWGVRSLPWLILTDKKHIVRVEGFSINELDEKITTLKEK